MKWLEELATELLPEDEQKRKILLEKVGGNIAGNYVTTDIFNNTKSELETANTTMANMQEQIKGLDNSDLTKENEELKGKITGLTNEFENYKNETETREANRNKTNAIKKGLANENANPDAVDLLLNDFKLEDIELDDNGQVKGWDSKIATVKESRKTLFGTIETNSVSPTDKDTNVTSDDVTFTRNIR